MYTMLTCTCRMYVHTIEGNRQHLQPALIKSLCDSRLSHAQAAIHAFSKDHASIGDVLHRGARLRLDAAGLTLVLSSAQEELYASLLALQGDEVGRIESLLKEVPRPDASSHAPLKTQIGQTKVCMWAWVVCMWAYAVCHVGEGIYTLYM